MSNDDSVVLERARKRRHEAERVLTDLGVVGAWQGVGEVAVEGALALDLVVAHDIDLEVVVPRTDLGELIAIWLDLRAHPSVVRGSVIERPEAPLEGVYFLLVVRADDVDWSIETWVFQMGRAAPRGADLVEPLRRRLNDANRVSILQLKEQVAARSGQPKIPSVRVYEAVLEHGVETLDQLDQWFLEHAGGEPWLPT
jgi:hypothetical protein